MRRLWIAALIVAGAAPWVAGQKPTAGETRRVQQLEEAEAALAQARADLASASDALEALVLELEDDHQALTEGDESGRLRAALVLTLLDSLERAQARLEAARTQGRTVLRGTRRSILEEAFAGPLRDAATVDPRLALWIGGQVAQDLSARSDFTDLGAEDLAPLVANQFPADESWAQFWNRALHDTRPESRRYIEALADYEAAGLAFDRLHHPERYGPRGEPAPTGMVIVPGGNYQLGPNNGWQRPARRVSLKPFALDRREVTRREYALFVNAQPEGARGPWLPRGWALDEEGTARVPPDRREHPVLYVSWQQAAGYAAWAGKRLPTEDEWEAAAAGPGAWAYPWGNEYRADRVNGAGANPDTVPVESYPQGRSAAGCFDMAGNAWEWTATLEDGTDVERLPDGLVNVVIRGGGFSSKRDELATRYRWTAPSQAPFENPHYDRPIGFRCAQDL